MGEQLSTEIGRLRFRLIVEGGKKPEDVPALVKLRMDQYKVDELQALKDIIKDAGLPEIAPKKDRPSKLPKEDQPKKEEISKAIIEKDAEFNKSLVDPKQESNPILWRDALGDELGKKVQIPQNVLIDEFMNKYLTVEQATKDRSIIRILATGEAFACNSLERSKDQKGKEYTTRYYIMAAQTVDPETGEIEECRFNVNATMSKVLGPFWKRYGFDAWFTVEGSRVGGKYRVDILPVKP